MIEGRINGGIVERSGKVVDEDAEEAPDTSSRRAFAIGELLAKYEAMIGCVG